MGRLLTKFLIFAVICDLIWPINTLASSKTIAIAPLIDGNSDNISSDLSASCREFFVQNGFQVVSGDKIEAVTNNFKLNKTIGNQSKLAKNAEEAIVRAKEHFYNSEYAEADAQIKYAIRELEKDGGDLFNNGWLLRDAYITGGVIVKHGKVRRGETKDLFKKALVLDPGYQPNEKSFSPSVIELFNEVKNDIQKLPKGAILVESDPKIAEVFINGVFKGVTPLEVSALPEGVYRVLIKTNKHDSLQKEVEVIQDQVTKLKEKLVQKDSDSELKINEKDKDDAKSEITEGLRIADILNVPKIIFVDVNEGKKEGEITFRMIDRQYRAGHDPITVNYNKSKKGLAGNLAKATTLLIEQASSDLAENPAKYLDLDGVENPGIIGKKKRPLFTIPAFWAVIGGIVAAGAGGAAAAILSGGGHPPASGTGSVNIQFR